MDDTHKNVRKRAGKISPTSKPLQNDPETANRTEKTKWYPNSTLVFVALLAIRLASALYNQIWDCDETYNFWEPLHYTLYKHGFQTWEYSPQFGLRSYLYIYLHTVVLLPFKYLGLSKVALFYTLRVFFALLASLVETKLYKSITKVYGAPTASFYFLLSLTSCAMFFSTTTFLPSSFSMHVITLSYAYWLQNRLLNSIFLVAMATLLGWPFAAILGLPIVLDCLIQFRTKLPKFIIYSATSGLAIGATMIAFDSYFFGEWIFAPLNIILYNVFPKSALHGPDIYGKEPISFYIINCVLNFNIVFILAALNALTILANFKATPRQHLLLSFAFYAWILVFFTRPHKEERFLYPIYPLMLLLAAFTLNSILSLANRLVSNFMFKQFLFKTIPLVIILFHAILSVMRVFALLNNYSSQIDIFLALNEPSVKYSKNLEVKTAVNVCVGKEWYRYPSSFFLPESYTRQKWRLRFLKSNFGGQLPGDYLENGTSVVESTRFVNPTFNDINAEVRARYTDVRFCDFLVDSFEVRANREYEKLIESWRVLYSYKLVNVDASERLYRALYFPFFYEKHTKFHKYELLKRI